MRARPMPPISRSAGRISAVSALQLLVHTGKAQPGGKALRINLVMPKSKG